MKILTDEIKATIDKYLQAQNVIEEFHNKLIKIIIDVFPHEPHPDEIVFVDLDDALGEGDNLVHICYEFGDGYGRESVKIPYTWLAEGFDYKADHARRQNILKERKRRLAEAKKKADEAKREAKERAEYERLKQKYGD